MMHLFRALGSAIVVGVGVKAGGDLYSALRRRVGPDEGEGTSPIDDILGDDDAEAKLRAEKARIEAELERLASQRGQGSE